MLSVHPTLHLSARDPSDPSLGHSKGSVEEYALANIPGDRLSTGFGPHPPDYVGIAKAASAGWAWGLKVGGDVSVPSSSAADSTVVNSTLNGKAEEGTVKETQLNGGKGDDGGRALLERSIEEGIRKVLEESRCVVLDCVLEGI